MTLIERILEDIRAHEGFVPFMYCDPLGYVTLGYGRKLEDAIDARSVPFFYLDTPNVFANGDAKEAAYEKVHDFFHPDPVLSWSAYRGLTNLRISQEWALNEARAFIEGKIFPSLRKLFSDFDDWPEPAKRAIVDIAYNCGIGWYKKFPSLLETLRSPNDSARYTFAIRHCTRKQARRPPTKEDPEGLGPRNLWTIARFREAALAVA